MESAFEQVIQDLKIDQHPRNEDLLRQTAEWWCEELGWPKAVVEDSLTLKSLLGQYLGRLVLCFKGVVRFQKLGSLKPLFDLFDKMLANEDDYNKALDEVMAQLESKDYVILVLSLVAIGFLIYKSAHKTASNKTKREPLKDNSNLPNPEVWILVLVINQKHSEVIAGLKGEGDFPDGQALANATGSLWLGQGKDYGTTGLARWFREPEDTRSADEYSVYFAKFKLDQEIPGLGRGGTNKVMRYDAFQKIIDNHREREISSLLPKEAWKNNNLYQK